jgi:hypothetical protein
MVITLFKYFILFLKIKKYCLNFDIKKFREINIKKHTKISELMMNYIKINSLVVKIGKNKNLRNRELNSGLLRDRQG